MGFQLPTVESYHIDHDGDLTFPRGFSEPPQYKVDRTHMDTCCIVSRHGPHDIASSLMILKGYR